MSRGGIARPPDAIDRDRHPGCGRPDFPSGFPPRSPSLETGVRWAVQRGTDIRPGRTPSDRERFSNPRKTAAAPVRYRRRFIRLAIVARYPERSGCYWDQRRHLRSIANRGRRWRGAVSLEARADSQHRRQRVSLCKPNRGVCGIPQSSRFGQPLEPDHFVGRERHGWNLGSSGCAPSPREQQSGECKQQYWRRPKQKCRSFDGRPQ